MSEQEPKEIRDYETVLQDDLRPSGNGKDCFYCGKRLGAKHTLDCVIRDGANEFHVAIKQKSTGVVREYRDDSGWDEGREYDWTEGNHGCDCNRHMCFQRAAGEAPSWDFPCDGEEYSVLYVRLPDNTLVYL